MSSDEERRRSSVDSSDLKALEKGITTRVLAERLRTLSEVESKNFYLILRNLLMSSKSYRLKKETAFRVVADAFQIAVKAT